MTKHDPRDTSAWRLVDEVVGRDDHPLASDLHAWLAGSGRYRAWVEANLAKIRKKVRGATDPDALLDVRAELLLAHRLIADRRFELAFEAYGARQAGPDFTATFRGTSRLNLEVTRPRGAPTPDAIGSAILAKLRQLPPSVPNVLVLALESPVAPEAIAAAAHALRTRADARDPWLLARAGTDGPRGFYESYLRLGAVLAWADGAPVGERVARWPNPSARIAVPVPALAAAAAALAA